MQRISKSLRVNLSSIRAFSTEATTASTASSTTTQDVQFPIADAFKHRTTRVPMPFPRGEAWGQKLVTNADLPTPTGTWTPKSRRTGIIFTKIGMTHVFDQFGLQHPLTILHIDDCQVTNVETTKNKEGRQNIQVGGRDRKEKNVTKSMLGHFQRARVQPKFFVEACQITADSVLPIGWRFDVRHFVCGQYIDVRGTSTGKGFQGVMKRYGFGGQPASHGVSITHRSLGSTGMCQDPGKVLKNKRMPGRMGGNNILQRNVRIYQIDPARQCILVMGQVPGPYGAHVTVYDALKKPFNPESPPPFPTFVAPANDAMEVQVVPTEMVNADPYMNGGSC